MLPPKLAQIIVNLAVAGQPPAFAYTFSTLSAEPASFCKKPGSWVMTLKAAISDERMVKYSIANVMEWLSTKYPHGGLLASMSGDATNHQWDNRRDYAVASETYLGRPFTASPTPKPWPAPSAIATSLSKKFLTNLRPQLHDHARLCIAVPSWQTKPANLNSYPLLTIWMNWGIIG
jgi:hypothetical protein